MQTVFLTGGTGFIGRHLVAALLNAGCEIRCLVRSPDRAAHLRRDGVQLVPGALEEPAGWATSLAGCDAVINAGGLVSARHRDDLFHVNGRAVGAVADACAARETPPVFVHLSSLAAGGPAPRRDAPRDEAADARPVSEYGASKRAGELELERRAPRLPATILRPGIVFGEHDTKVAAMFQSIERFRLHVRMGFRDAPLSLIHAADLAALAVAAAERGERLAAAGVPGHGVYQACDDREHPTYAALGRKIARALGRSVLVFPLPLTVAWPASLAVESFWSLLGQPSIVSPDKLREATAGSWAASAAKARDELGFAPAATLDARLRQTADWLRAVMGWQARPAGRRSDPASTGPPWPPAI
jgi:nucleoside-diphosphate-sugar epimerase